MAFASLSVSISAAQSNSKVDPHSISVIDGGIGPCSADFTVTDAAGAPVYDAKIRVHIAYGFMNTHKLDLEVGTNIDGKATVTGLPDKIKHGFYFHASQGDRTGEAFDDPANTCKAKFSIILQKKPQYASRTGARPFGEYCGKNFIRQHWVEPRQLTPPRRPQSAASHVSLHEVFPAVRSA